MIEKFHGMFRLLDALAMPSLALVDGMALGGGCELAVFCDMVFASDRATFGQPEIKVGVFPPWLPRLSTPDRPEPGAGIAFDRRCDRSGRSQGDRA